MNANRPVFEARQNISRIFAVLGPFTVVFALGLYAYWWGYANDRLHFDAKTILGTIALIFFTSVYWFLIVSLFFYRRHGTIQITERGVLDSRRVDSHGVPVLLPWSEIERAYIHIRPAYAGCNSIVLVLRNQTKDPFNVPRLKRLALFGATKPEYKLCRFSFNGLEQEITSFINQHTGYEDPPTPTPDSARAARRTNGKWTRDHDDLVEAILLTNGDPRRGQWEMRKILARGLDLNVKSKAGDTVIDIAKYHECPLSTLALLRDNT